MDEKSKQKKILFVDDDHFLLDMYSLKFSKAGYDVAVADSTDSALTNLRDGRVPDIMLVDIVMPGMDGLDFVQLVRKERLAPNAVIIMLTNQASPEDIAKSKKINVDGYIVKATSIPSEVLTEVENICNTKKN